MVVIGVYCVCNEPRSACPESWVFPWISWLYPGPSPAWFASVRLNRLGHSSLHHTNYLALEKVAFHFAIITHIPRKIIAYNHEKSSKFFFDRLLLLVKIPCLLFIFVKLTFPVIHMTSRIMITFIFRWLTFKLRFKITPSTLLGFWP